MLVTVLGNGQLAGCLKCVLPKHHTLTDEVSKANLIWAAEDTLVTPTGEALLESVIQPVSNSWKQFTDESVVLVSSQVPPGFTADLRFNFRKANPVPLVEFAYCVENIKADSGETGWLAQQAFIVGFFNGPGSSWVVQRIMELLMPFNRPLHFMDVKAAEFAKCAINSCLATNICFANEIGELARRLGVDAGDVERGMRTDQRLQHLPIRANGPFANGHLGRDLRYLLAHQKDPGLLGEVVFQNELRLPKTRPGEAK